MNLKVRVKRLEGGRESPRHVVTIDAAGAYHYNGAAYADKQTLLDSLPPEGKVFFCPERIEDIDEWAAMARNPDHPQQKALAELVS
jgi:hypothetical protein